MLAAGGCRAVSVRRGQGCPRADTGCSRRLWWARRRRWLSSSAAVVVPLGKSIYEGEKHCVAVRSEGRSVKNSPADAEVRAEGGQEDPQVLKQRWTPLRPPESPHWSRLLTRTAACGDEPVQEQIYPAGACLSCRTVSHERNPMLEQRQSVTRKERQSGAVTD